MIPAPNFTQIPNVLIDEMIPILGFAEMKVLWVLCRKIFGWHKVRDQISLSQLEKCTGLERQHVLKATKSLIERGLITKEVSGEKSAQITHYTLVIREDSNNFTQCRKDTPPSVAKTPTKERPTKEIITPPSPPSFANASSGGYSPEGEPHPPNSKDKKKKTPVIRERFGEHVELSREEHEALCLEMGKEVVDLYVQEINDHLTIHGKKPYKDYAAVVRSWKRKDDREGKRIIPVEKAEKWRDENEQFVATVNRALKTQDRIPTTIEVRGSRALMMCVLKDYNAAISLLMDNADFKKALSIKMRELGLDSSCPETGYLPKGLDLSRISIDG